MSMPKGHKVNYGYATIDPEWGGLDFRKISDAMTCDGQKMNHSTARNIFLSAMQSIAASVIRDIGGDTSGENVDFVARNPLFQSGVAEILRQD